MTRSVTLTAIASSLALILMVVFVTTKWTYGPLQPPGRTAENEPGIAPLPESAPRAPTALETGGITELANSSIRQSTAPVVPHSEPPEIPVKPDPPSDARTRLQTLRDRFETSQNAPNSRILVENCIAVLMEGRGIPVSTDPKDSRLDGSQFPADADVCLQLRKMRYWVSYAEFPVLERLDVHTRDALGPVGPALADEIRQLSETALKRLPR